MKILLIGNGFDLAHGLPTSYKHFIQFCIKVRRIYEYAPNVPLSKYKQENLDDWVVDNSIVSVLLAAYDKRKSQRRRIDSENYDEYFETPNDVLNEFYSHIKQNAWIQYFENIVLQLGENWIDFENEISKVIQGLDSGRLQIENDGSIANVEKYYAEKIVGLLKASKKNLQSITTIEELDKFIVYLNGELERLVRALEIYISEFINNIFIPDKCKDIQDLNVDIVLSFNYSDTFHRIYDSENKLEYDYIHGKADVNKNIQTCNLVLGIDEYLDDESKNYKLEFLPFKKYYQRIYKTTGNKHLNWIDEIKEGFVNYQKKKENAHETTVQSIKDGSFGNYPFQKNVCHELLNVECPQHTLYIFGHSLDVSDRDILKMFISNDNVQTKIFYYRKTENDKTELGKIIRNLIRIIGQEELVRRTGGLHKTIEFIPQSLN